MNTFTKIREEKGQQLSISVEPDEQDRFMFLWVPDVMQHEHEHIPLSVDEARVLELWLRNRIAEYDLCSP